MRLPVSLPVHDAALKTVCRLLRYVQLGATSTIKGESDQRKYEKARARRTTFARSQD